MRYILPVLALFLASCGQTVYVVRHAEKATGIDPGTMKTYGDPPLSQEGEERALQLKQVLGSKDIRHIFSTNTVRTVSTARPLKEMYLGMPIQLYNSKPDSMKVFLDKIRNIRKGNILIVGHSNTIDDIANQLAGKTVVPGDLKDSEYNNLYVLKRKKGGYRFENRKYGAPAK